VVYAQTREATITRVEALALQMIADRFDHGETIPELDDLFAISAQSIAGRPGVQK
jgi:hypothetical protein